MVERFSLYDMLGIRKERIDPGEPWENYAETLFSIQRRLADHAFSNARTWPELQQAHQTWWTNYNSEHHFAHRERQDGRHSPEAVLRGVLGRTYPDEVLSRVLYATQFTRYLDKQGYVKFKHWRLFGENCLAGEEVSVWVYESTLKIEYQTTALTLYSVRHAPDQQITEVANPRRLETRLPSGCLPCAARNQHRVGTGARSSRWHDNSRFPKLARLGENVLTLLIDGEFVTTLTY